MKNQKDSDLFEALKNLLLKGKATTQELICKELELQGFEVNQSKISRLLRKMHAIKIAGAQGQVAYSLAKDPAPPTVHTQLKHLILDIVANESLIVIFTSPGSASMVARILDYNPLNQEILGTIAGDDTIFVAPKSVNNIKSLVLEIKNLLKNVSE